jgi:hypothetical protein
MAVSLASKRFLELSLREATIGGIISGRLRAPGKSSRQVQLEPLAAGET